MKDPHLEGLFFLIRLKLSSKMVKIIKPMSKITIERLRAMNITPCVDIEGESKIPVEVEKISSVISWEKQELLDSWALQYNQVILSLKKLSNDKGLNEFLDAINIQSINYSQYNFIKENRPKLYFIAVQLLKSLNIQEICTDIGFSETYTKLILDFIYNLDSKRLNEGEILKINLILGDISQIERSCEVISIKILSELL